jgi:hypothetical protein
MAAEYTYSVVSADRMYLMHNDNIETWKSPQNNRIVNHLGLVLEKAGHLLYLTLIRTRFSNHTTSELRIG